MSQSAGLSGRSLTQISGLRPWSNPTAVETRFTTHNGLTRFRETDYQRGNLGAVPSYNISTSTNLIIPHVRPSNEKNNTISNYLTDLVC